MRRIATSTNRGWRHGILLGAVAWALLAAQTATASLQVSIAPSSQNVAAGSTGDAFNVTLTNTGSSSVSIGAFAFELTASSSYVSLTQATTATSSPYIFAGSSAFGPTISVSPPTLPGQTILASDVTTLVSGVTVGSGSTVGLGHVLFNVASNAPTSVVPVTFLVYPDTSVTDATGDNLSITSYLSGTIDIQGGTGPVAPEPSTFTIFAIGAGLAAVFGIARRKGRCQAEHG
jgi:hypothetical protein